MDIRLWNEHNEIWLSKSDRSRDEKGSVKQKSSSWRVGEVIDLHPSQTRSRNIFRCSHHNNKSVDAVSDFRQEARRVCSNKVELIKKLISFLMKYVMSSPTRWNHFTANWQNWVKFTRLMFCTAWKIFIYYYQLRSLAFSSCTEWNIFFD